MNTIVKKRRRDAETLKVIESDFLEGRLGKLVERFLLEQEQLLEAQKHELKAFMKAEKITKLSKSVNLDAILPGLSIKKKAKTKK
jgi:hypothetical protein